MNTINAQEYINQLVADKSQAQTIHIFLEQEKLSGELIISDYPNLDTIDLKNHELTTLTINNCPNLKSVNVRGNKLSKLEMVNCEQVSELMAGNNELSQLDLSTYSNLKKLIVPDNPYLTQIVGLNLTSINNVNITNTL
ncbi:826_t:CDS:1, partial [Scutellospora calospora]